MANFLGNNFNVSKSVIRNKLIIIFNFRMYYSMLKPSVLKNLFYIQITQGITTSICIIVVNLFSLYPQKIVPSILGNSSMSLPLLWRWVSNNFEYFFFFFAHLAWICFWRFLIFSKMLWHAEKKFLLIKWNLTKSYFFAPFGEMQCFSFWLHSRKKNALQ